LDEVYGPVWFSFWASVKEGDVGGPGEGRDERYEDLDFQ